MTAKRATTPAPLVLSGTPRVCALTGRPFRMYARTFVTRPMVKSRDVVYDVVV